MAGRRNLPWVGNEAPAVACRQSSMSFKSPSAPAIDVECRPASGARAGQACPNFGTSLSFCADKLVRHINHIEKPSRQTRAREIECWRVLETHQNPPAKKPN